MVNAIPSSVSMVRAFSTAAATYDRYAQVQRRVGDRLLAELEPLSPPRRILDIGCGTGALSRALAERFPSAEVWGIDIAPAMIREARRCTDGHPRLHFEVADLLDFRPEPAWDLLVSNCSLHWIFPIRRAFRPLASLLRPGGTFALAVMMEGTLRELHAAREAVAPGNPAAAKLPALMDITEGLRAEKFLVSVARQETVVEYAPDARNLLRRLRATGVTGGPPARGWRPLTPAEIRRLIAYYDTHYQGPNGVCASYEVGYFLGRRDVA